MVGGQPAELWAQHNAAAYVMQVGGAGRTLQAGEQGAARAGLHCGLLRSAVLLEAARDEGQGWSGGRALALYPFSLAALGACRPQAVPWPSCPAALICLKRTGRALLYFMGLGSGLLARTH